MHGYRRIPLKVRILALVLGCVLGLLLLPLLPTTPAIAGDPGSPDWVQYAHNGQPPAASAPLPILVKFVRYYRAYVDYAAAVEHPDDFPAWLVKHGVRDRTELYWYIRLYLAMREPAQP